MKTYIFALMSALLLTVTPVVAEDTVAIINAHIIDGNGGTPIQNGIVIVRGEKIEAVGPSVQIPEGATIIDAEGRTVMPGLADMHVHLAAATKSSGRDILGYQKRLNALMYAGVTTVFDTGNFLPFVAQLKQEINAGRIVGPSIYYVGPLIETADPNWPLISRSMVSNSQAGSIVRHLKKNGAAAVKAYGRLSTPQIRALTWAAKKEGLPVIVDVWIRNGSEYLMTSGIRAFGHIPNKVSDSSVQAMKENEIFIITTNSGRSGELRLVDPSYMTHPLITDTTDQRILDRTLEEAKDIKTTDAYKFKETFIPKVLANTKKLSDGGVLLVAGTDGAASGVFLGESLHHELEMLVSAGLTPLQAITTATKNAALLLKDLDTWGTLEVGKRADILIINGRPDQNISDTRKIDLVMQRGRIIDRDALKIENNNAPVFVEFDPS